MKRATPTPSSSEESSSEDETEMPIAKRPMLALPIRTNATSASAPQTAPQPAPSNLSSVGSNIVPIPNASAEPDRLSDTASTESCLAIVEASNEALQEFSRLLQMADVDAAMEILIPQKYEERRSAFATRNLQEVERIMPLITCSAILKEKDQANNIDAIYEAIKATIESMGDILPPAVREDLLAVWAKVDPLLKGNNFVHKYLHKAKSMTAEQIEAVILTHRKTFSVPRALLAMLPIIIKTIVRSISSTAE